MEPRQFFMATADDYERLVYETRTSANKWYSKVRCATAADLTVKALAQLLDDEAEQSNYHEFVGVHGPLADRIHQNADMATAIMVLKTIVEAGGIRRLKG